MISLIIMSFPSRISMFLLLHRGHARSAETALNTSPQSLHFTMPGITISSSSVFSMEVLYLAAGQQSLRYSLQFLGKALLTLLLAWLVLRAGGDAVAVLLAMAASFLIAALSGAGVRGWLHVPGSAERALLPCWRALPAPC